MKALDQDRARRTELLFWLEDRGYVANICAVCVEDKYTGSFYVQISWVSESEDCGYVIIGWEVSIYVKVIGASGSWLRSVSLGKGSTILEALEEAIMLLGLEKVSALEL